MVEIVHFEENPDDDNMSVPLGDAINQFAPNAAWDIQTVEDTYLEPAAGDSGTT